MKTGYLYFLGSRTQEAVKIGFAVNLYSRMASLKSGNPAELKVWGVVPIEAPAENALHAYLKPHRIVREWYRDCDLTFCLLAHLQETWGDKVEAKTDGPWAVMGDEYDNPGEIYLTSEEVLAAAKEMVDYLEQHPDAEEALA
jgi:hypothetical protein